MWAILLLGSFTVIGPHGELLMIPLHGLPFHKMRLNRQRGADVFYVGMTEGDFASRLR